MIKVGSYVLLKEQISVGSSGDLEYVISEGEIGIVKKITPDFLLVEFNYNLVGTTIYNVEDVTDIIRDNKINTILE